MDCAPNAGRRFRHLLQLAELSNDGQALILDVGCWNAGLGLHLRQHRYRWRYVGVDIELQILKDARRAYGTDRLCLGNLLTHSPVRSAGHAPDRNGRLGKRCLPAAHI